MSTARTPAFKRLRSADRRTKADLEEEIAQLEAHLEDRQSLASLLRVQNAKADEELQSERNACLQLEREVDSYKQEKEEVSGTQSEKAREAFTRLRNELSERDSSLMGYAEQIAEVTDRLHAFEAQTLKAENSAESEASALRRLEKTVAQIQEDNRVKSSTRELLITQLESNALNAQKVAVERLESSELSIAHNAQATVRESMAKRMTEYEEYAATMKADALQTATILRTEGSEISRLESQLVSLESELATQKEEQGARRLSVGTSVFQTPREERTGTELSQYRLFSTSPPTRTTHTENVTPPQPENTEINSSQENLFQRELFAELSSMKNDMRELKAEMHSERSEMRSEMNEWWRGSEYTFANEYGDGQSAWEDPEEAPATESTAPVPAPPAAPTPAPPAVPAPAPTESTSSRLTGMLKANPVLAIDPFEPPSKDTPWERYKSVESWISSATERASQALPAGTFVEDMLYAERQRARSVYDKYLKLPAEMRTQKTFLAWENELGSDIILSKNVSEQDKNMYVSRYFGDWKKGVEKVLKFFLHVSFEDTATTTTTATIGGVVVDLPGPDREKRTLATLFFWLEMYIFNNSELHRIQAKKLYSSTAWKLHGATNPTVALQMWGEGLSWISTRMDLTQPLDPSELGKSWLSDVQDPELALLGEGFASAVRILRAEHGFAVAFPQEWSVPQFLRWAKAFAAKSAEWRAGNQGDVSKREKEKEKGEKEKKELKAQKAAEQGKKEEEGKEKSETQTNQANQAKGKDEKKGQEKGEKGKGKGKFDKKGKSKEGEKGEKGKGKGKYEEKGKNQGKDEKKEGKGQDDPDGPCCWRWSRPEGCQFGKLCNDFQKRGEKAHPWKKDGCGICGSVDHYQSACTRPGGSGFDVFAGLSGKSWGKPWGPGKADAAPKGAAAQAGWGQAVAPTGWSLPPTQQSLYATSPQATYTVPPPPAPASTVSTTLGHFDRAGDFVPPTLPAIQPPSHDSQVLANMVSMLNQNQKKALTEMKALRTVTFAEFTEISPLDLDSEIAQMLYLDDTGANRVSIPWKCLNQGERQDAVARGGKLLSFGLAAEQQGYALECATGECIMPGEPLLPGGVLRKLGFREEHIEGPDGFSIGYFLHPPPLFTNLDARVRTVRFTFFNDCGYCSSSDASVLRHCLAYTWIQNGGRYFKPPPPPVEQTCKTVEDWYNTHHKCYACDERSADELNPCWKCGRLVCMRHANVGFNKLWGPDGTDTHFACSDCPYQHDLPQPTHEIPGLPRIRLCKEDPPDVGISMSRLSAPDVRVFQPSYRLFGQSNERFDKEYSFLVSRGVSLKSLFSGVSGNEIKQGYEKYGSLISYVSALLTAAAVADAGPSDPGPTRHVTWGPNPPAVYAQRVIENMQDPHHLTHFPKKQGCEACDRGKMTFSYQKKESSKFQNKEKDQWIETDEAWVRVHVKPRKSFFSPVGSKGGPDLEDLENSRCTFLTYSDDREEVVEDEFQSEDSEKGRDELWTGFTVFIKQGVYDAVRARDEAAEEQWASGDGTIRICADLMGHFPVNPDGFRFLWVSKRLAEKGRKAQWFVQPLKSKEKSVLRDCFDLMEEKLGTTNQDKMLKFDRESFLGKQKDLYDVKFLTDRKTTLFSAIPERSNTSAGPESICRWFWEDARSVLWASCLPPGVYWAEAAQVTCLHKNQANGHEHPVNEVVKDGLILGRMGYTKIAPGLYVSTKAHVKTVLCCFLGYDDITRGGVEVLWFDIRQNRYRRNVVLERDVNWVDEFAFERKREDLKEFVSAFVGLGVEVPVARALVPLPNSAHFLDCSICKKRRAVTETVWQFVSQSSWRNKVRCTDIGLECIVPEDRAPWSALPPAARLDQLESRIRRADAPSDVFKSFRKCKERHLGSMRALEEIASQSLKNSDISKLESLVREAELDCLNEQGVVEGRGYLPVIKAKATIVSNSEALHVDNPERDLWVESLDSEVKGLLGRGVLAFRRPSEIEEGDEILPSVVVFTKKRDGRFKSRLVACGNFQSVLSKETYAGVVSHDSWLATLATAWGKDYYIGFKDITQAFNQSEKKFDPKQKRTLIRLGKKILTALKEKDPNITQYLEILKSMYGERTAPTAWFGTFAAFLEEEQNFRRAAHEVAIWFHPDTGVIVFTHVDDVVCLAPTEKLRDDFDKAIGTRFDTTEMSHLENATRENPIVHLAHDIFINHEGKLCISLAAYLEGGARTAADLLGVDVESFKHRTQLPNCASIENTEDSEEGEKLSPEMLTTLRGLVGIAGYAVSSLRGDGSVVHSLAATGLAAGHKGHLKVAKELIEYLYSTRHRELQWSKPNKNKLKIVAYWDANFGSGRARTGGVIQICQNTVAWISSKQSTISQSTTEAELIAGSTVARAAVGLANLLQQIFREEDCDIHLLGDNQATISMVGGQSNVRKVRHLSLADLYLRELVRSDSRVTARWIEGEANVSDMLTKVLKGALFEQHLANFGFSYN